MSASSNIKTNLVRHRRALHEGIKYTCGQCQHKATRKESLAQHRRAIHEGIRYPCGQCQHQATSKGDLGQLRRAFYEEIKNKKLLKLNNWFYFHCFT